MMALAFFLVTGSFAVPPVPTKRPIMILPPTPFPTFGEIGERCRFPECTGCKTCADCQNSGGCAWHTAGAGHGAMCLNVCKDDGTCLAAGEKCPDTLDKCCCTGIHTGDIFDLDLQRKCCPEAFGLARPLTKEMCEESVFKTGFCVWNLKMCPDTKRPTKVEPTNFPTKVEPTSIPTKFEPPTTCPTPICLGLNEGEFPSMLKGKCESNGIWSGWFDLDNQSGTGDWELYANIPNKPCGDVQPVAAECQTTGGVPWDQTGLTFSTPCGPTGIVCQNAQNNNRCVDMRVRYQCPGDDCVCKLPNNAPKDMKASECGCCSDNLTKGECKKNKCSTQKKKKGKVVMKKKKCQWKNDKCSCKFKKPLEGRHEEEKVQVEKRQMQLQI